MKTKMVNKGPKPKRPIPLCGNPRCCSSTGIGDEITHGWGKLDNKGYWEYPCPDTRHIQQDNEIYDELRKLNRGER